MRNLALIAIFGSIMALWQAAEKIAAELHQQSKYMALSTCSTDGQCQAACEALGYKNCDVMQGDEE